MILSAPQWTSIVLERGWNQENNSTDHLFFLKQAPHSPFTALPLGLREVRAQMVPAKGTPTLK